MTEMCTSSTTPAASHRFGIHPADATPADSLCVRQKGLKRRGLSKYYASKSQSFSSLELALSTQFGESALGLAKRPSSQDLVHAVQHALSNATSGSLDRQEGLFLLQHRASSMETRPYTLQHSLTAGPTCLRETSSVSSSTGGASVHGYRPHATLPYDTPTSAACCASPRESEAASICELCLPPWLHNSTDELCAALHRTSLLRETSGSSSATAAQAATAQHRYFFSGAQSSGGLGSSAAWAAPATRPMACSADQWVPTARS